MEKIYYVLAVILVVAIVIYMMKNQSTQNQSQSATTQPTITQPNENPNDIIPLVSYPDLVLEHPIYYDRYGYDYGYGYPYFRYYHHDHDHKHHHTYVPDHRMPSKPIIKSSKLVKPMPKPKK
jgi:hypothetical protein